MNILVTNDDGIYAPGIAMLAEAAAGLGEVTVIAPDKECSAMSHRITLTRSMRLERCRDFPVAGVKAFSLDGTPADCVRAAFLGLLKKEELPDIVFSGVNKGANCGFDVLYSATVGSAMEAVLYDIPAVCFSQRTGGNDEVLKKYLLPVARELIDKKPEGHQILNVNFPSCSLEEFKGILYDRKPAGKAFFDDCYLLKKLEEDKWEVELATEPVLDAEEGSDIRAVLDGYISIGVLNNFAML